MNLHGGRLASSLTAHINFYKTREQTKDPAGDEKLQAPRVGDGMDFNPSAPYRMYHGKRVPGFPSHPHRGFETVTATLEGHIDHCDSLGNCGRYGGGDIQWMTAGSGIVHSEMFPLVNAESDNTLRLFQLWLNLPKESKMAAPTALMHWAESVPKIRSSDGLSTTTVFVGNFGSTPGLPPPPNSWASRPEAEVACWFFELRDGGVVELPVASGNTVNRRLYVVEGPAITVTPSSGMPVRIPGSHSADLDAHIPTRLTAEGGEAHVLVLQGKPIGEPVVQHGPFVGNTREDILDAMVKYEQTRFGGWPWPTDDHVFPRGKGRFALFNGIETTPNTC